MLVATLMVIAVSGYAAEQFVPVLTGDVTNLNVGEPVTGIWSVWGSQGNDVSGSVKDVNGEKYLELTNPSGTDFWHAQLGYEFEKALDRSKKYKFSFKAKCASGSSQLQWQYQNKEFKNQGGYGTFDINDSEWKLCEVEFKPEYEDDIRIIINFGKYQNTTIYIDDIEFGYYEEVQKPEPDPGTTPTGSLNNTMYYDGTQWCLMLEDFEGENAVERVHIDPADGSGTVTVVDDPLKTSKKSLNFYGAFGWSTYCYIEFTLPEPKKLSESYFKNLIFDVVYNQKGTDNTYKTYKVNIDNTSTQLGQFSSGNANTESWSKQQFDLAGKYTNEKTFRIYIGGHWANTANLYIDNIRLSVPTTAETIGTCGSPTKTDVNWMLDGNTLYISGTGDIADYDESSSKLWSEKKDNISNVIIGEGITAIGKQNFYDHNGLESVVLPSTLEKIGEQGLYVNNGNNETKPTFTFHSNPTMGTNALHENSTATLVLDDALSPFFEATSANTFNGGIQYKRTVSATNSTITLPFTPSSGLENCKFYKLYTESENKLVFEEVTNLEPNKPYIMVMTEPNEINFSTNESITIKANAKASETTIETTSGTWKMHGTYSTLVKNSGDNAYGFTGNTLKRNTGNMTVKPFRAYFTMTSKDNTTPAKDYLDVIFGGEVTGIERNEFSPEGITEIFSLDGKKHDCLQKGMNIVKMNNGSIKKIVIK